MTVHHFEVEDAEKYGVEKAVILYNLRFWLEKNKANNSNKHDGYYWTYNSTKAFTRLFPYFKNASKIHRLLTQLEEEGAVLTGNYNKIAYDRTKWYSMPEFAVEDDNNTEDNHFAKMKNGDCKNEKSISEEVKNGNSESAEPIPDINTDNNPDENTDSEEESKPKRKKGKGKMATSIPDDLQPTQSQIEKMDKYGIDVELFMETFRAGVKSKGRKYKCWTSAITTWINNEIKFNNLVPVAEKRFDIMKEDWSGSTSSSYKQNNNDVYHPSHSSSKPVTNKSIKTDPNWHWNDPLPTMTVPETYTFLEKEKRSGESTMDAYNRLYEELKNK